MKECNGLTHRCDICNAKFKSKRRLMQHMRVCSYRNQGLDMESNSEMENTNDGAPKAINMQENVNEKMPIGMIPNNHLNPRGEIIRTRPYYWFTKRPTCPICKKDFSLIEWLKDHYDECLELYQPLRHCPVCKETFGEEEDLKSHIKECEEVAYTCQVCDEDFQTIKRLERHMAAWHFDINAGCGNKRKRGGYESEGEESDGDSEHLVKRRRNDEDNEDDGESETDSSDSEDK